MLYHLVSEHSCDKLGCRSALVIDGNVKNHQDVCMATAAGFVQFKGLRGQVQTGCSSTPGYNSLYCSLHKPSMVVSQNFELSEDHSDKNDVASKTSALAKQEPVGIIIG